MEDCREKEGNPESIVKVPSKCGVLLTGITSIVSRYFPFFSPAVTTSYNCSPLPFEKGFSCAQGTAERRMRMYMHFKICTFPVLENQLLKLNMTVGFSQHSSICTCIMDATP